MADKATILKLEIAAEESPEIEIWFETGISLLHRRERCPRFRVNRFRPKSNLEPLAVALPLVWRVRAATEIWLQ
jgi:hypothetical protein